MDKRGAHDMTQGSLRGHIIRMTVMMLAGMVLQMAYSLVDIYWVAHLGKEAIAAVSIVSNLNMVTMGFAQVIGVGTVALVAQAMGRKDEPAAQRAFNQSQSLAVVAGGLFLAVTLGAGQAFVNAFASDAKTAEFGGQFIAWFGPALAMQFSMVGLGSALRGIGNMKPGLVAQAGSVLLNMLLAPFLIFGWLTGHAFGVAGAAMSTFFATLAAVIGLALYLRRPSTYFRVNLADWKPDFALWRRILGIGLPSGAEMLLMTSLMFFIYGLIRGFGPEAQAGFGIGIRIMQSGFMPAVCLSFAVAAVAGQNFGARNATRVRDTFFEGAKLNVAMMAIFTVLCHLAPLGMMHVFSKEAAVAEVGAEYLRVVSYNYMAFGLIVVAGGMFQGMGNTWPSLLASGVRIGSFIGIGYWLSRQPDFTLGQLWWVSVASVLLQAVISLLLLRREFGRRLGNFGEIAALQTNA